MIKREGERRKDVETQIPGINQELYWHIYEGRPAVHHGSLCGIMFCPIKRVCRNGHRIHAACQAKLYLPLYYDL